MVTTNYCDTRRLLFYNLVTRWNFPAHLHTYDTKRELLKRNLKEEESKSRLSDVLE